jgi:hypothetical protein
LGLFKGRQPDKRVVEYQPQKRSSWEMQVHERALWGGEKGDLAQWQEGYVLSRFLIIHPGHVFFPLPEQQINLDPSG